MKRLKTAEQAREESYAVVNQSAQRAYKTNDARGGYILPESRIEVETERETYWADRCEALERELNEVKNAWEGEAASHNEVCALVRALEWHSVEDVLPEFDWKVLVQTSDGPAVASRVRDHRGVGWFWWASCTESSGWNLSTLPIKVTHWALPLLPDGTVPRG